jgi:hypothetical protein
VLWPKGDSCVRASDAIRANLPYFVQNADRLYICSSPRAATLVAERIYRQNFPTRMIKRVR